jgi:hypothetical protein
MFNQIKIILTTEGKTRNWDEKETEENSKKTYYAEAYLGKANIKSRHSEVSKEQALGELILALNGAFEETGLIIEEKEEWN